MIYHCMDVYRRNYKIKFQVHLVRHKDQTTKNVRLSSNNSKSMHVLCKRQNIFYQNIILYNGDFQFRVYFGIILFLFGEKILHSLKKLKRCLKF